MVVKKGGLEQILEHPRGPLYVRLEPDRRKLYLSRNTMQTWVGKGFGSYSKTRADLIETGVLVNANIRKNLGAGTFYSGGLQPCWEINIDSPALMEAGVPEFQTLKEGQGLLSVNMEALL